MEICTYEKVCAYKKGALNNPSLQYFILIIIENDYMDVEDYLRRLSRGSLIQLGCVLGLSYSRMKSMEQLPRKLVNI